MEPFSPECDSAFNLESTLAEPDTFLCQKRTATYKQFVIVKPNLDYIFKGPYSSEACARILFRVKNFSILNLPFVVFPIFSTELKMLHSELGSFLLFPNLIKEYPLKEECFHTETFKSNSIKPFSYKVMERNGVIKLGDYLKSSSDSDWVFSSDKFLPLLVSYITFFIFSVGDVGPHNTLVDVNKKFLYIIDYDENRGLNEDTREIFYFKKDPTKKYHSRWLLAARSVYPNLIDYFMKIQNLFDIDETLKIRAKLVMDKLNVLVSSEPISNPISTMSAVSISTMSAVSISTMSAVSISTMSALSISNLGKMEWKGLFGGSITFSGFHIDIMKSGIQKYIRRGMVEKALMCCFELYRMPEVNSSAVAIRTNMLNRLAITCAEDIGSANLNLTLTVLSFLKNSDGGKTISPEFLIPIIDFCCSSEKTRIGSHIWRTYAVETGRKIALNLGLAIDDVVPEKNTLETLLKNFYIRLGEKNPNCLVWLSYYMLYVLGNGNAEKAFSKQKMKKTGPMKAIWELIGSLLNKSTTQILSWAFFNFTENRPFLILAVLCILYDEKGVVCDLTPHAEKFRGSEILQNLLTGIYILEIDEFIIDKHTSEGRRKGADRNKFVTEGAIITNENQKYASIGSVFEKIYLTE